VLPTYDGKEQERQRGTERIRPCSEVKGFEFECTFTDEKDVVENTIASTIFGPSGKAIYTPRLTSKLSKKDKNPENGKAARGDLQTATSRY